VNVFSAFFFVLFCELFFVKGIDEKDKKITRETKLYQDLDIIYGAVWTSTCSWSAQLPGV
jgi:hypothetical protein